MSAAVKGGVTDAINFLAVSGVACSELGTLYSALVCAGRTRVGYP